VASQRPTLLGVAPQRRKEAFGLSRMFGAYGQISPVAADRRHALGRANIGFNMSDASMAKHAIQCNRHGLHPKKSLGEATFRQLSQRTYPRNHTRERSAARHLPTSHRQRQIDVFIERKLRSNRLQTCQEQTANLVAKSQSCVLKITPQRTPRWARATKDIARM
jgi:hypothetical protein